MNLLIYHLHCRLQLSRTAFSRFTICLAWKFLQNDKAIQLLFKDGSELDLLNFAFLVRDETID